MEFTIESLLVRKNGNVTGPSAPKKFADDMLAHSPYECNRLAKITFADNRIMQRNEGEDLTAFDHYLIGYQNENGLWLSLWVDEGKGGIAAAMCFEFTRIVRMSPLYHQSAYIVKPCRNEFLEFFNHVFANQHLIAIK